MIDTENEFFSIVFENEDFIVVNKKHDINFHCEDNTLGLVAFASGYFDCKLFSVHRLDKMTSGLIILAKSSANAALFYELFKEHLIQKYYLAISDKKPKKKQGLIKGGMEKSRRSMWKLTDGSENLAITQFFSYSLSNGKRLFLIKPLTGKTHQIRVALKSIGSGICGDPLYATENASKFDRGYLHAYALEFTFKGEKYSFKELPKSGELFHSPEFKDQILRIDEPNSLPWPKVSS